MPKFSPHLWINRSAGYYGTTKKSSKNPNHRKGAIYPWAPVVNYRRVTYTDGEYIVREYKSGRRVWRECANHELKRHARELQQNKENKELKRRLINQALEARRKKKRALKDEREATTI